MGSLLDRIRERSGTGTSQSLLSATSNTAQSQSSNVSGFIHHEPDESFKFVKQGNTGSYDF